MRKINLYNVKYRSKYKTVNQLILGWVLLNLCVDIVIDLYVPNTLSHTLNCFE